MELFSLTNKYALDNPISEIDSVKYSSSNLTIINNKNSNISITFPGEDAYICLQNSYISLEFEVLQNDNTRFVDNDQISLVIFGPAASFSEAKLVTSSGKHLVKVDNLHPVCLMYKCTSF